MDEHPYPDTFSFNNFNNVSSSDSTNFTNLNSLNSFGLPGAAGQDHINFQYNMSMNEHTGYIGFNKTPVTMSESKNHLWKYNEDKILKDIQEYVTSTYKSHYCGHQQEYQGVQTIDLMAAKELASDFCQANILKYGSRYGDKDGRSKRDLLKVIHYAMLLLHFDGHYSRKDNGLTEFR